MRNARVQATRFAGAYRRPLGDGWPLRYLSYMIDTVPLTAALMLTTVLHQYPFVHSWLTVKVVLLALYIALGGYALKHGRTRAVRIRCWFAALTVYAAIISVARTHHRLGILRALSFGI